MNEHTPLPPLPGSPDMSAYSATPRTEGFTTLETSEQIQSIARQQLGIEPAKDIADLPAPQAAALLQAMRLLRDQLFSK